MTHLKQWHEQVCSRDNYQCTVCRKDYSADYYFQNGVNQYVCGHHIRTQKAHPELVYVPSNGICVCLECHNKIHKGLVSTSEFLKEAFEESIENTEIAIKNSNTVLPEVPIHTFPNGQKHALGAREKLCKCKKFIAVQATGICMSCEKRAKPQVKSEKKK